MRLSAGIVLYNPDVNRLKTSFEELQDSISTIYLVDNCSNNIAEIQDLISNFSNITLICNSKNLGIAKALNQILSAAWIRQDDYLLTLDQDSILTKDSISKMLSFLHMENVAIFCPVINDLNKKLVVQEKDSFVEIERCITSGSIMNLEICKNVGLFDEQMFIDYVDFDYCKRIRLQGKKIIRIENSVLNHEIGKRTKRRFLFWSVFPTNHNELRIYYYVRNIYYYLRKFRNNLTIREIIIEYQYLLWKFVSIVLYERNKGKKLQAFFKGKRDSKKMKIG